MKTPSIGTIAFGFVGITAIVLFAIGAPNSRIAPVQQPDAPPPRSVSAAGFTLASTSVDLPIDDQQYPDGPHADVINANCTSCHSASMALNQPPLSADQWKETVAHMRDGYNAPIAEKDVAAIISYLMAMPSQKGAPKGSGGGAADASGITG